MPVSFYILAAFTLIAGIAAMSLRNLVHCALCLALSFIGMAGLFMLLHAPFVAFAQILVYVGAVAILIVFAILLTRNAETQKLQRGAPIYMPLFLAITLAAVMVVPVAKTAMSQTSNPDATFTTLQLGQALMKSHIIPLELIGLLLTVALLGAIVIAIPEPLNVEENVEEVE